MRTVILPQNPSPVALDGGGLANHPMFKNQENKINEKQRKKNARKEKLENLECFVFHQNPKVQKVPFLSTRIELI